MTTRQPLVAKTKLVDGIRVNISDNTVAHPSSIQQEKAASAAGLSQGSPVVSADGKIDPAIAAKVKPISGETQKAYEARVAAYNASGVADEPEPAPVRRIVPPVPAAQPAVSLETQVSDSTAPDNHSGEDYVPRLYQPETTAPKAQSVEEIQRGMQKNAQGEINSLRDYEKTLLTEQNVINDKDARSTQGRNVINGLAGSSEADFAQRDTAEKGKQATEKIHAAVETQVQGILSEIRRDAVTEAREQRSEALQTEAATLQMTAQRQQLATESVKNLVASGATFDGLRKTDPKAFEYLARQFGGTEQLRGVMVLNTPQEQILDKGIKGGSYFIARQNPMTGRVTVETVDLGLPPEYTKTVDAGDRILAIPDGWDGDPSKLVTINKGLTPAQGAADGGGDVGDNPQLYSGLSSKTATAVRSKVAAWKTEPAVQNFSVIQEGRNFAGSLSDTTTNPSDDQGLIYALAKALDPGSVVREGEYATAQKYSQSLIDSYGKGVTQAINGTGFLTEQARRNIKDTIEARYKASKTSYDAYQKQYQQGIDSLTGRSDGAKFLTDYTVTGPASASEGPAAGTDGTAYGFPGYHSDGAQWVPD